VDELCSSIAVLDQSRLRFRGTPEALRGRYGEANLERAFMKCIRDAQSVPAGLQ
jgi:ABC-type Na+ transport system ATPase subunit NatA